MERARMTRPLAPADSDNRHYRYGGHELFAGRYGRPIKARFRWTRHGPERAHWEQAFSLHGRQWETNWTMEHIRAKS